MSTIHVNTITTVDGTGNITVSRPLSGSGASLTNLPAANLTGALPAINGAAITNLPADPDEIAKQSSDPTVSSPATPILGQVVLNTTSGEMFVCTTVSVGANVWTRHNGDGSALTNLSSANLTGALPAINGASLTNLSSANLTGALPAISGASLTGIVPGPIISASDPAVDTNPSSGLGSQWANSTSGEFYICTDATTDENVWTNVGAGSGDIVPIVWYGTRGVFSGGGTGTWMNTMDYITITTPGNATDFGDRTNVDRGSSSCSNGSRGLTGGGITNNIIDYITFANTGNATDFGDLTVAGGYFSSCGNGIRGLWGGGYSRGNTIDYVTIATTGNAIDFGNLTVARQVAAGASNEVRALFAGGETSDVIDYVTVATTGNATDFGNLTVARGVSGAAAGCSSETRALFGPAAGAGNNVIDYVTVATTGNATDFGDSLSPGGGYACSSGTRGIFAGGLSGSVVNTINYVTISTPGNGTDFGDLTVARRFGGGMAGE
jgi:hypothetical protein